MVLQSILANFGSPDVSGASLIGVQGERQFGSLDSLGNGLILDLIWNDFSKDIDSLKGFGEHLQKQDTQINPKMCCASRIEFG